MVFFLIDIQFFALYIYTIPKGVLVKSNYQKILQWERYKPRGHWLGVWGILISSALFIIVSLVTTPPREKADEFIGFLHEELPKMGFSDGHCV